MSTTCTEKVRTGNLYVWHVDLGGQAFVHLGQGRKDKKTVSEMEPPTVASDYEDNWDGQK